MGRLWMLLLIVGLVACGDDSAAEDAAPPDTAEDGFIEGDAAEDGAAEDSAAEDSAAEDSAAEDSAAEDSAAEDSAADSDELQDSSAEDASAGRCDDGERSGDETDIDCGGSCDGCRNFAACSRPDDCLSGRCEDDVCTSPEGTHPDIVRVVDVAGRNPGGRSWADSYSVGDRCYCETSFDHNIGPIEVETPVGTRTVREVCDALGPGPGSDDRPLYNDVQCGNGPANDAGDEDDCPGRVDIGREGCGQLGPHWDLSELE
ncbi:MAG: hypothetical protein AAF938_04895 [Myxococcota bacterium]